MSGRRGSRPPGSQECCKGSPRAPSNSSNECNAQEPITEGRTSSIVGAVLEKGLPQLHLNRHCDPSPNKGYLRGWVGVVCTGKGQEGACEHWVGLDLAVDECLYM